MLLPVLTLLLLGLALQACLFTGDINTKPQVQIVVPDGPFGRGQTVMVHATAYDPDGGNIRLEWSKAPGDCPIPLDPSQRPTNSSPSGGPTFAFTFDGGAPSTVCVWVLATDDQGATNFDAKPVSSQNRPPQAAITVLEPTNTVVNGRYELYSTFQVSAATSTDPDGDPLSMQMWMVLMPPPTAKDPIPQFERCPGEMTDVIQCLDVRDAAGLWKIGLTVFDGLETSMVASQMLYVDDDHPACVSKTDPAVAASPIVLDPSESRTLTITEILDDGSPLPTPVDGTHKPPTFQWKVSRNGGAPSTIAGYENLNALTLPANTYATGDEIVVTVTISDGVAMHLEPTCNPGCPTGCPQSATWTVDYR
jgi:hypothetical protein